MVSRHSTVSRLGMLGVGFAASCTMLNPAFDEGRQTVADSATTSDSDGSDEGHDAGDGDGDGDPETTAPGDGDPSDTGDPTDTGSPGDGDPVECELLEQKECELTMDCNVAIYQFVELEQDGSPICLSDTIYEGCLPTDECDPVAGPYWCNPNTGTAIKIPLTGCLPTIVDEQSLGTCANVGRLPLCMASGLRAPPLERR